MSGDQGTHVVSHSPFKRLHRRFIRLPFIGPVAARPRLLFSLLAGLIVSYFLPPALSAATRLLIAWNSGTLIYLALAGWMIAKDDHETLTRRAATQDDGRFMILTLAIVAAVASVGAIVIELAATKSMEGAEKSLHIGLAAMTIVTAWTFIHLSFALHYAHEYASERRRQQDCKPEERGGLLFPGTAKPTYWDFLYFSYVIGVASQTADIAVCSPMMRRIVLVHGVVAFFFNTTILALTINIAAGLI